MFDYLGELLQAALRLLPRLVIVPATHAGVRFRRGARALKLLPGLRVYWPLVTEVETVPVVRQTVTPESQVVLTDDDVPLSVSGIVIYRIIDVRAALVGAHDVDECISDAARLAIADAIAHHSLPDLKVAQKSGELAKTLKGRCEEELETFGVQVLSAGLTDFAPCRVLRVLGNNVSVVEDQ